MLQPGGCSAFQAWRLVALKLSKDSFGGTRLIKQSISASTGALFEAPLRRARTEWLLTSHTRAMRTHMEPRLCVMLLISWRTISLSRSVSMLSLQSCGLTHVYPASSTFDH